MSGILCYTVYIKEIEGDGMNHQNKPMAATGLTSFRYDIGHGYVMIGARDITDALSEAKRSIDGIVENRRLQIWDGSGYVNVY
jgi:hypothetical protein